MKTEAFHFFSGLFGNRGGRRAEPRTSREVIVTSNSQPHVLQEKMKERHLTHGETVMANISPVRLETNWRKMALYFCPMRKIEVLKSLEPGDGMDIPPRIKAEGLTVPLNLKSGLYELKNVKLTSNGVMQITATAETTWEPLPSTSEF